MRTNTVIIGLVLVVTIIAVGAYLIYSDQGERAEDTTWIYDNLEFEKKEYSGKGTCLLVCSIHAVAENKHGNQAGPDIMVDGAIYHVSEMCSKIPSTVSSGFFKFEYEVPQEADIMVIYDLNWLKDLAKRDVTWKYDNVQIEEYDTNTWSPDNVQKRYYAHARLVNEEDIAVFSDNQLGLIHTYRVDIKNMVAASQSDYQMGPSISVEYNGNKVYFWPNPAVETAYTSTTLYYSIPSGFNEMSIHIDDDMWVQDKSRFEPTLADFTMNNIYIERSKARETLHIQTTATLTLSKWMGDPYTVTMPALRIMDKSTMMTLLDYHVGNEIITGVIEEDRVVVTFTWTWINYEQSPFLGDLSRLAFQFYEGSYWDEGVHPVKLQSIQPIYDEHCNVIG